MKATERKNYAKQSLITALNLNENFLQIDDYSYVLPVEIPDGTLIYARLDVKACADKDVNRKDGTVLRAFDYDEACVAYQEKLEKREQKKSKS